MKKTAETILFITRTEKDLPFLQPLLDEKGYLLHPLLSLSRTGDLPRDVTQVIIDLNFDISRLDQTLQWCREHYPDIDPILLSPLSADSLTPFISALPRIIIKKPYSAEELLISLGKNPSPPPEEEKRPLIRDGSFLTASPRMEAVYELVRQVAPTDAFILIRGETGTGKEIIARLIHRLSLRSSEKLVTINCAALPESLLESELFGYKKGAFTGAASDKPGRFALAGEGTIFLDEIGEISPALQVRLLRVLQEHTFEPLGSVMTEKTEARVIAETNRNLSELVKEGKFREDLFYRINIIRIELPPLKNRKEDIPVFTDNFINKYNSIQGKSVEGAAPEVYSVFMSYDWPGNVRELENIIERAFVICPGGRIELRHIPDELTGSLRMTEVKNEKKLSISGMKDAAEKEMIISILEKHNGNLTASAAELDIHRATLYRKMKKLNIRQ